jgi:hypothetical protein
VADKKAAKLRRREKKQEREKDKAERTGNSPAQDAEEIRRQQAEDPAEVERRVGLDGSVGGDTVRGRRTS